MPRSGWPRIAPTRRYERRSDTFRSHFVYSPIVCGEWELRHAHRIWAKCMRCSYQGLFNSRWWKKLVLILFYILLGYTEYSTDIAYPIKSDIRNRDGYPINSGTRSCSRVPDYFGRRKKPNPTRTLGTRAPLILSNVFSICVRNFSRITMSTVTVLKMQLKVLFINKRNRSERAGMRFRIRHRQGYFL